MQSTDILIVGGGLTGLTLANALANSKCSVMLVESREFLFNQAVNQDARPIALTRGSVCMLEAWNVWSDLFSFSMPISQVHVSEKGGFGFTRVDAKKMNVPALGYVIAMPVLMRILYEKAIKAPNLTIYSPAKLMECQPSQQGWTVQLEAKNEIISVHTSLLVAADGEKSSLRDQLGLKTEEYDYHQSALVSNISLMRDHQGIAYERFTQTGAIALLPMTDHRCGLVWTDKNETITQLSQLPQQDFLYALQKKFGFRLGKFVHTGRRQSHPLLKVKACDQTAHHAVLLGNSAHTQHPLAAQGFNLGIRDIYKLAALLTELSPMLTMPEILENYVQQCQYDQFRTMQFTHQLSKIFTSSLPFIFPLRNLAMLGLDMLPLGKQVLARMSMGIS